MTLWDTRATPADADVGGSVKQGSSGLFMNEDTYSFARMYVARGWSLVALHWITAAGQCSCGRAGCKAAGKHPRDKEWTERPAVPERWRPVMAASSAENIGILTGRPSGFWVLDFDPADADDDGDALHRRLRAAGLVPNVRTGGGGYHWRFTLPDFEVRNRQSAGGGAGRTHGLPRGWDVRGEGGQVVAPPSVSGKGAYVELNDAPPYVSPGWLLDMIRPQPSSQVAPERGAPPDHMVSTTGPAGLLSGDRGANAGSMAEGSSHLAERVQAYCTAAMLRECEEYAALTDGRRGEAAAAFARRLVELANLARWPLDAVQDHFARAMEIAAGNGGGGGYAPHEVAGQWARAIEHVGDRAAVMPPGPDVLPGFTPPFVDAGAATPAHLAIVEPGDAPPSGPGGPATGSTLAPSGPPPAPPPGMSPSVWAKVQALDDIEAAKRFRAAREAAGRPSLLDDIVTADALDSIPDPVPLVDGWLFVDTVARINGKPGQGKSFVAIDIAAHVAAGRSWHGRAVRPGPVLYMAAEGLSGVKLRVQAWERAHDVKLGPDFMLLRRAVQVTGPDWPVLVDLVRERRPALIVLDTQARVTVGLRENDNSDMGQLVLAADALREATGGTVLLIHHKGKSDTPGDGGGRGGNAVEGAMGSEFDVWKSGQKITVLTTRQKDIEGGEKLEFVLNASAKSAVLVQQIDVVEPNSIEAWKAQARALYEILRTMGGAAGVTEAVARNAAAELSVFAEGNRPKYAQALVRYAWNNLVMRGLVIRHIDTKGFRVHVMPAVGPDGVLTPNVGEWAVADPPGWQTYAPDAVDPEADWTVNLGKTGGTRVSEAAKKMKT